MCLAPKPRESDVLAGCRQSPAPRGEGGRQAGRAAPVLKRDDWDQGFRNHPRTGWAPEGQLAQSTGWGSAAPLPPALPLGLTLSKPPGSFSETPRPGVLTDVGPSFLAGAERGRRENALRSEGRQWVNPGSPSWWEGRLAAVTGPSASGAPSVGTASLLGLLS